MESALHESAANTGVWL